MRQFEKEYREAMPQTIGETDRQFDDHNYTEFLEKWIVKLLATPDVSVAKRKVCPKCGETKDIEHVPDHYDCHSCGEEFYGKLNANGRV